LRPIGSNELGAGGCALWLAFPVIQAQTNQERGFNVAHFGPLACDTGLLDDEKHVVLLWSTTMRKPTDKNNNGQAKLKDLVVVTLLSDVDQAKEYQTLLKLNDIPATIKEQLDPSGENKGVAIMVPEDFLDEAHVVIESQDAYDDFYDYALEDEEEVDFDADLLDDEF
jgi:hypothetical protein